MECSVSSDSRVVKKFWIMKEEVIRNNISEDEM